MIPEAGATRSTLTHLEGSLSRRRYEADRLMGVDPEDGRPLLARYDLEAAAGRLGPEVVRDRAGLGLWRWHELLPIRDWSSAASLGEGDTPLLRMRRLGRRLGLERLLFKAESLNPTGSFKARGMAVAVSRAVELGVRHLVAPSAGNAAGALAAYAAAAGVEATVIMPSDAPAANKTEVLVAGATLLLVDGLISDCARLAGALASAVGAFDLSTLKEPYRVEGKKTMGFELAEQTGWSLPDVVVYPTGGGTGLVGMWKAFDELEVMGMLGSRRPRMVSVQSDGCAPIARAFRLGHRFAEPWENAATAAAGMRVPGAVGDFLILDGIRGSGGTAISVPEQEIATMQRAIGAAGGGYASLETSAAVLAASQLRADGWLDREESVVVFDTGAGFKSEPPDLELPKPLAADGSDWEPAIAEARRRSQPEPSGPRAPRGPVRPG